MFLDHICQGGLGGGGGGGWSNCTHLSLQTMIVIVIFSTAVEMLEKLQNDRYQTHNL